MRDIVITSGGMDSTTAVFLAHRESEGQIECMSFDYGQRHRKELECARATAEALGVPWHLIDLRGITSLIGTSALTNDAIDVPEGHYAEENMKITVVPNRNAMMLNIAIARAVATGAERILTGVHAGDHAVYPDCRPEFINAQSHVARIANEGFIHPDFYIHAPFVNMTKTEIASLGDELGVAWEYTWTCYKGGEIHCGRCSTCVERLEAMHDAGVPDNTVYADTTYWREVIDAAG